MKTTKITTLVQIVIPNAADVQALVTDTPASLTLCTPYATVQVQIGSISASDNRTLPGPRCSR